MCSDIDQSFGEVVGASDNFTSGYQYCTDRNLANLSGNSGFRDSGTHKSLVIVH
jgi:hypothetical protein